jgi:hypothetical protein
MHSQWFKPLRKNLGKKNCELASDDIERISRQRVPNRIAAAAAAARAPAPGDRTRQGTSGPARARPGRRRVKPDDTTSQASIHLVRSVGDLQQRAVQAYRPVVDDILRSGSRDADHIERTLDGLLDSCGHEPVLAKYKEAAVTTG